MNSQPETLFGSHRGIVLFLIISLIVCCGAGLLIVLTHNPFDMQVTYYGIITTYTELTADGTHVHCVSEHDSIFGQYLPWLNALICFDTEEEADQWYQDNRRGQ